MSEDLLRVLEKWIDNPNVIEIGLLFIFGLLGFGILGVVYYIGRLVSSSGGTTHYLLRQNERLINDNTATLQGLQTTMRQLGEMLGTTRTLEEQNRDRITGFIEGAITAHNMEASRRYDVIQARIEAIGISLQQLDALMREHKHEIAILNEQLATGRAVRVQPEPATMRFYTQ